MRIKLKFEFDNELVLPLHYNHIVQGFIYNNVTDEVLRSFLHEVGFKNGKRKYNMFTFSNILGRFRIDRVNKKIIYKSPIELTISSLVDDFVNDISTSFFKSDDLHLINQKLDLVGISTDRPMFKKEEYIVESLSPIVTYSSVKIDGRNKTIFYSPLDSVFSDKIKDNLIRKYEAINGSKPEDDRFSIEYIGNRDPRKSVIRYQRTMINGYNGKFKLKGNPELIRLGYFVGFGSKNSQGFGCVEMSGE